ncbi:hypothetical protein CRYUN_Cryun17cG0147300 [Craigia yunnanensis]
MNMQVYNYQTHSLPEGLVPDEASPGWLNKGDNSWQLTATAFVGLQSVPRACNSIWEQETNGYYSFADSRLRVLRICFCCHYCDFARWIIAWEDEFLRLDDVCSFVVDAVLYRWGIHIWGEGFLQHKTIDYAGGYVIHLSSGVAGFTAAYWVGPRHSHHRQHFPPNNIIQILGGAGFLWIGWTGSKGGSPFTAGLITSLAIINTHICTAASLLVWLSLDMAVYKKSLVIGAVQLMITGLVCITPGAGPVDPWAAVLMGMMFGSIPWYTMMVLHRKSAFFQSVDDTLGVFHTHAMAGVLGGFLSGIFARPKLLRLMYNIDSYSPGLLHSKGEFHRGLRQMGYQFLGAIFITAWNAAVTSIICLFISRIVNLRMDEEDLEVGDDAAQGEEAYALWGDGERMPKPCRLRIPPICRRLVSTPI